MLSSWLPWILGFVILVVLPVLVRLLVGDDLPDNAIRQEQPGDSKEEDPVPDLGDLLAA